MTHNQHKEGITPNIVDISEEEKMPMGLSQWRKMGKKFGYWSFFEQQVRKSLEAEIMEKMPREKNIDFSAGQFNQDDIPSWDECLSQCKEVILSVFKEK